jgi:hypothetical protein
MTNSDHVSRRNQTAAAENIRQKIRLLELWLEQGLPTNANASGSCPVSLRQFNAWSVSEYGETGIGFKANGATTLRQNSALTKQVLTLLSSIRERDELKRKRRPMRDVNVLRQELALERSRRQSVEREYARSRVELERSEKRRNSLSVQFSNLENQAKTELGDRDKEISRLKHENKALILKLAKYAPLAGTIR